MLMLQLRYRACPYIDLSGLSTAFKKKKFGVRCFFACGNSLGYAESKSTCYWCVRWTLLLIIFKCQFGAVWDDSGVQGTVNGGCGVSSSSHGDYRCCFTGRSNNWHISIHSTASLFYLVKFSTKWGQIVVQQGRALGVWVSSVTFLII